MKREELINILDKKSIAWQATGSRVICNPPPMDTDEDYIALMVEGFEMSLILAGFEMNTDPQKYEEMPDFLAFRNGEFNVIITYDVSFYKLFCAATAEAKSKNLLDKDDRVSLFQKVLYGRDDHEIPY